MRTHPRCGWLLVWGGLLIAVHGSAQTVSLGVAWDRASTRPALASSVAPGNYAPGNITDADPATGWMCGGAGGMVWVDLGARLRLAAVGHDLRLENAGTPTSDIVAYTPSGWQTVATHSGAAGAPGVPAYFQSVTNTRYIGLASSGWLAAGGTDTNSWANQRAQVNAFQAYNAGFRPKRNGQDLLLQDFCVFYRNGYTYCVPMMKMSSNQGVYVSRSRDLVQWEDLGIAVRTRTAEDACMVWAPHVVEENGRYYMFYTGVTCPQSGQWCQRICVASTLNPDDPANWERTHDVQFVVAGTAQSWFRPDHAGHVWTDSAWADCRDPMVFRHKGRWYMFYSGMDTTGGICGVATAPAITGPWRDYGAVLRVSHGIPESCFVVEDPEGGFVMVFNHASQEPDRGIKIARGSALLPSSGQVPFTNVELLSTSTANGFPGWAHEFLPGTQPGELLGAALMGYWVFFQDAQFVKEPNGWTIGAIAEPMVNTAPTQIALQIGQDPFVADGQTLHTVTLVADDADGVADLRDMRVMFNMDLGDRTRARGYLIWGQTAADVGYYGPQEILGMAEGGGVWGWQNNDWGHTYITPVACRTGVSGRQRTVTWTFNVRLQWYTDGPRTGNYAGAFVRDKQTTTGWVHHPLNFGVSGPLPTPTLTPTPTLSPTRTPHPSATPSPTRVLGDAIPSNNLGHTIRRWTVHGHQRDAGNGIGLRASAAVGQTGSECLSDNMGRNACLGFFAPDLPTSTPRPVPIYSVW